MKKILLLALFLCLIDSVLAMNYSVDFNIVEDKVLVDSKISYGHQTNLDLALDVAEDAKALSLYLDGKPAKPFLENNKIIIKGNAKEVSFNYLTKEILGTDEFLVSLSLLEADKFTTSLLLPEGYVLQKPVEEKTLTGDAVYPKPTSMTSDGQRIIINWERSNVKQDDDFSIFVKFKKRTNYSLVSFGILFMLFILFFVFKLLLSKEKQTKKETKVESNKLETKHEPEILKHLKEDEETVINVLRQREGQCEQGTLRVITGFSKATLSRILKELEDRKVIYKEKRGKKNLVFLK